ncbi:MAG: hypothetical protein COB53_08955 [Elusimicrobia bacterium]|nr:MAG: hypothetical protein COB53_08955 [Elusimicrobiota bacterium]
MIKSPLRPIFSVSALLAAALLCAPFAFANDQPKPQLQKTESINAKPEADDRTPEAEIAKTEANDPFFENARDQLLGKEKPSSPPAGQNDLDPITLDDAWAGMIQGFGPMFHSSTLSPGKSESNPIRTDAPSQETQALVDTMLEANSYIEAAPDKETRQARIEERIPTITSALQEGKPDDIPQTVYDRTLTEVSDALVRLGGHDSTSEPKREQYFRDSLNMSHSVVQTADKSADTYRDALIVHAQSNLGLGRYQPAIDDATTAARLNQDDERAYTTRALAYYQMQNYNQAMEDAQRALRLNKNNSTAFKIAKLSRNRLTTTKDLKLDRAARAAADQIGREYESMEEERSEAERIIPQIARANPTRANRVVDSLNTQALSYTRSGKHQAAYDTYTRALVRDPKNTEALQRRGHTAAIMGHYRQAITDASAILDADSNNPQALLMRSRAFSQTGRFQEAKRDADRLVGLAPKNAAAYKARGRAKENLGDVSGMIFDFRRAAALDPGVREELRPTARRYDFNLDGKVAIPSAALPNRTAETTPKKNKGRHALIILGFSVVGGLLFAIGFIELFRNNRRERRNRSSLIENASPETNQALAAGGELEGGFKILRVLGNGGMGVVYEAQDKALDRKVAIKKMRDEIQEDPRERARFLDEARLVAKMHHPNIVDIHSIVEDNGELYLVFEHVDGETLDQVMNRKKRLSVKEVQYILRGVCNALEYAHHKAIIHRDLKPSNIMITKEGRVKVMDFGIARQAKDALLKSTKTNHVAGTPQYMAPEQEEGTIRPESDIFSLGTCLYELVTGERPFTGPSTTASKINKRYTRASRVRQELPAELDQLIDDALEPDPDKRIHTVVEFRARLDAIAVTASKSA